MKKFVLSLLLFFASTNYSQVENEIINMFGITDSTGRSFLIYEEDKPIWGYYYEGKKINVFDLSNYSDSTITEETGWWQTGDFGVREITDYDFYSGNPNNIIYTSFGAVSGSDSLINPKYNIYNQILLYGHSHLQIDQKRNNVLYLNLGELNYNPGYIKSYDYGKTWPFDSTNWEYLNIVPFNLLSLYPSSDSIMFGIDSLNNLTKSYDAGLTSEVVEESGNWNFLRENLYYDIDGIHIYAVTQKEDKYFLFVSDNYGNKDSWNLLFTSQQKISISVDDLISGKFSFATNNNIYQSTDYGQTFNVIHTLDKNIVGIYNIPNTDTIYAATGFTIWEITNGNQIPIKQVISNELLSYYPLEVGNKWYYEVNYIPVWVDDPRNYILTKEVTKDILLQNGKKYFETKETRSDTNTIKIYYERIDSVKAQVYRLQNGVNNNEEYLVVDFHSEIGSSFETFVNYSNDFEIDSIYLKEEKYQDVFSGNKALTRFTKIFNNIDTDPTRYISQSYSNQIGKSFQTKGFLDAYDENLTLVAAFIYDYKRGDTTLVGVNKNVKSLPNNYWLSQNYPNPFNPTTTIDYTVPIVETHGHASLQLVVYDVLGREVATLVNQHQKPGNYSIQFDGSNLASGIYYYQLKVGSFIQTKKMILMK
ncbi:MAG: T9SS type A sorting domain-containing protein [Ignavibacteriales bacterium]|nr:T9SS type A sorting domain-containing protein [Ignavibacteriales bacterium]